MRRLQGGGEQVRHQRTGLQDAPAPGKVPARPAALEVDALRTVESSLRPYPSWIAFHNLDEDRHHGVRFDARAVRRYPGTGYDLQLVQAALRFPDPALPVLFTLAKREPVKDGGLVQECVADNSHGAERRHGAQVNPVAHRGSVAARRQESPAKDLRVGETRVAEPQRQRVAGLLEQKEAERIADPDRELRRVRQLRRERVAHQADRADSIRFALVDPKLDGDVSVGAPGQRVFDDDPAEPVCEVEPPKPFDVVVKHARTEIGAVPSPLDPERAGRDRQHERAARRLREDGAAQFTVRKRLVADETDRGDFVVAVLGGGACHRTCLSEHGDKRRTHDPPTPGGVRHRHPADHVSTVTRKRYRLTTRDGVAAALRGKEPAGFGRIQMGFGLQSR